MEMDGKCQITILESESPKQILEEIIETFFKQNHNVHAYIDRGAHLNGLASTFVAKRLLAYITSERP